MKPQRNKSFVWLLTIAFIITQIILVSPLFAQPTTSAAGTGTDRICGNDRYQTAVAVSQKGWKTAEYAVLARGDNFADALCAGPLAQKYGGPILLTSPAKITGDTLNELKRLGVKHLFIAGGTGAVSQNVENTLKGAGIETIERIYGKDRYETSVKIAQKLGLNNKIILATGSDFPDALSISAIAAKLQIPILLTAKDKLPSSVNKYLQTKAVTQTYIVGGTGVISSSLEKTLLGVIRLAGSNRYETNRVIMQKFEQDLNFENIYVAIGGGPKGNEFADALTGAVLAAKKSSPLVLSSQVLPAGTAGYLKTKILLSSKVTGLGGKTVVPSSILTGIIAYKEQIPVAKKYSVAGTYGPETGKETIKGDVTISAADVTLQNLIIEGDLLLAQSIGNGNVALKDVTVKGKTIINGGGPNSIIMYNFNGQTVIIDVPDGSSVRLVAQGSTSINNVFVEGNGTLEESELTGTGFINVEIPAGAEVTLNGDFEEVSVEAGGAIINVTSGNINTLTIAGTAAGSSVNLGTGASVGTLDINAQSNITGQGQINNANINSANVTIQQTPSTTTIAAGLTANVGGQQQSGTNTAPPPAAGGGGGGGDSFSVTGVTLDKTTITISTGESETLVATVTPANATNKNITWASSAESVATVNNGVVTGVGPGTAGITATTADGNKVATCTVRVLPVYDTTAALGTWVKDRTEPQTWSIEDDIITLETKTEPNNNWYAWQGRKAPTDMNPTSAWKAETEIELTDELLGRDGVRTSMWLNVVDAKGTNIDWAILQFKIEADSGTKGWQYWDSKDPGVWVDIDGLPTSAGKYQLAIHYNNGKIIQFINGTEVNSYDVGETGISSVKEVIFNSYSFGESYTSHWKVPTVKYYKKYPDTSKFVFTAAALKTALAADDSTTIVVGPGTYEGNFTFTKPVKLISISGAEETILNGNQAGSELGTVDILTGVNGLQLGDINEGFTIIGIDGTPGLEKACVYFRGANSDSKVIGNIIEANGDAGLMTEYNMAVVDLLIDNNKFTGKTFTGDTPGGDGFGSQFTDPNVPRQLVVIGGGASGTNTQRITFTNNEVSGTAGGLNTSGNPQGNTLITIDAQNSTITGNTFAGTTTREGANLRARRPDIVISGNTFESSGLTSSCYQLYLQNNTQSLDDIADSNYFDYGVYIAGDRIIRLDRDALLASASSGSTIYVITDGEISETIVKEFDGPFSAGSGGNLPAFPVFSAVDDKIGGLYISENHKPLIMYFEATPIFRNQITMRFIPPGDIGASSYTLQISSDGTTWSNYQLEGSDLTTSSVDQDNFCIENPGGDYQYRLLVNGGPKDGYTSNHAEAKLAELKSAFTGYSLDESMMLTGVIAPFVGRGLLASFSAVKYIVDGKDVDEENYTDENMTFQWYRVNPVTYEMTAISGATDLSYTTTEADAGYLLLIKATGDDTNIEGYSQVFSQSDTVIPNKAYISNVSDSGFTLNLYKNVDSLAVSDLDLYDTLGNPVTIDSVTQGANKAIYIITADISSASEPYRLYNNSPFWRIVSDEGGHMMMQGVEIAFPL